MSEKYGFVYIWRDRKNNKYYIGSHWGREDDGYVCSSTWMRNAYRRRKEDFKRRIISRIYTNRLDLLTEEQRWFDYIKPEELKVKYYNMTSKVKLHWTSDDVKFSTISEKISQAWTDERREQQSERMAGNTNPIKREDVASKRLQTIEKNGGLRAWNKGIPRTEEQKKHHSEKMKGRSFNVGICRSEETKAKLSSTWEVTYPDGRIEVINNMVKFCNDNNLSANAMRRVGRGERKHYKNYKVKKIDV